MVIEYILILARSKFRQATIVSLKDFLIIGYFLISGFCADDKTTNKIFAPFGRENLLLSGRYTSTNEVSILGDIMADLETALTGLTAKAIAEQGEASQRFEMRMREVEAIRALASKLPDLSIVDGVLCSAKANSSMTDYDVRTGCGCHPEPGDDVVISPYTIIDGVKVHSVPHKFVIGTDAWQGMDPREGWKDELIQHGFSEVLVTKLEHYVTENPASDDDIEV